MDEQPQRPVDRREVVERHETVERTTGAAPAPPVGPGRSFTWLWVLLTVLVVGALAWFALSRGEPADLEVPEIEAPDIEMPADEPNIEINVPAPAEGEGGGEAAAPATN